ncbi:MAG TPA: phosphatidate cytidylyltransferase [Ignavibacteria bacterium]|nr:phosphatidate cytidylyltransferase [Ignavibacteria bacterium]
MSNLFKRVIVGVIGIPLLIAVFYFGGIALLVFSLIVSSIALWEFLTITEKKDLHPQKVTGVILSAAIILCSYFTDIEFLSMVYVSSSILICAEILKKEKADPLNPVTALFGLIYITIPFSILSELNKYSELNLVIYVFVLIWTCDTSAYFGGRFFGKHLLSPLSPKKTWEGSVSGFLFTVLVSLIIHFIYPDKLNFNDALMTGMIIGIFSQAGDLFESLVKRFCGVKDSSGLIPGHGGILDRFDSLIFAVPLIFIYFRYVK